MRLRLLPALFALVAVIVLGGCGSSSSSGAKTASVAPASSFLYIEAKINPSGTQEANMRSILADLPGTSAPQERLNDLLEKATESDKTSKVDYRKDVLPWLGDTAAVFVAPAKAGATGTPWGLVIAATDTGKAKSSFEKDAAAQKHNYRGVSYGISKSGSSPSAEGIVGGFAVIGNESGFKAAVDASKDGSLDASDRYKQATASASSDRVALIYEDLGGIIQALVPHAGSGTGTSQLGAFAPLIGRLLGGKPNVAVVRAEQQALVVDGKLNPFPQGFGGIGHGTKLFEQVPADSWLALGVANFGQTAKGLIGLIGGAFGGEQALADGLRKSTGLDLDHDVLGWMGDMAIFVQGTSKSTVGGGVLIQSTDPQTSKTTLTKIAALLARQPGNQVSAAHIPGTDEGYKVADATAPRGLYLLQGGDTVALTYGEEAAKAAFAGGGGLTTSPGFTKAAAALGSDYQAGLYVAIDPILQLVDGTSAATSKTYGKARPYLSALDYLVAGSRSDGGASRTRIGFKPSH